MADRAGSRLGLEKIEVDAAGTVKPAVARARSRAELRGLMLTVVVAVVTALAAGAARGVPADVAGFESTTGDSWVITDLAAGTPFWATGANHLNDRGQIVGEGYAGPRQWHAFIWRNGKLSDLGTLGGLGSTASAISERGEIVGGSDPVKGSELTSHAFLWRNGRMTDLGTLGGLTSYALALNEHGQAVGFSDLVGRDRHAVLWENGKIRDLGTLGGFASVANAINERGQVVGMSETKSGARHAFLWQKGRMTDLGALGRKASEAFAINDRSQIIGVTAPTIDQYGTPRSPSAFVWQNGKMTDLGRLWDRGPRGDRTRVRDQQSGPSCALASGRWTLARVSLGKRSADAARPAAGCDPKRRLGCQRARPDRRLVQPARWVRRHNGQSCVPVGKRQSDRSRSRHARRIDRGGNQRARMDRRPNSIPRKPGERLPVAQTNPGSVRPAFKLCW